MGIFNKNKQKLLEYINYQCTKQNLKKCISTNQTMTKIFDPPVSERHISRYLKSLKDDGKIEIKTSRPYWDNNKFRKNREIIMKNKFTEIDLDIEPELERILAPEKDNLDYQYDIIEEKVAGELLKNSGTNLNLLDGTTNVEKLLSLTLLSKREADKATELLDKEEAPNYDRPAWNLIKAIRLREEINLLLEWATFNEYENEYYITIYLGGIIPRQIKLTDYTNWTKDSAEFKLFKELFEQRG